MLTEKNRLGAQPRTLSWDFCLWCFSAGQQQESYKLRPVKLSAQLRNCKHKSRGPLLLLLVLGFGAMVFYLAPFGSRQPVVCSIAIPRLATDSVSYGNTYQPYDCVALEIADTPSARQQGLSGRPRLAATAGMLFVFDTPAPQCMWMKNMNFALDIIWLNESKKIVKIQEDVKPETYPMAFCSDVPTKYVIEVNAGIVRRAGLKTGQILQF